MCHEPKLAMICVSLSSKANPCFMAFIPIRLSRRLRAVSTNLEKTAAAFPAMIHGREELQDHILNLTQPC
jgi:hypothetical protein